MPQRKKKHYGVHGTGSAWIQRYQQRYWRHIGLAGEIWDSRSKIIKVKTDLHLYYVASLILIRYADALFSLIALLRSPGTFHPEHNNLPGKQRRTGALHENPGIPCIYWEQYNRYQQQSER